MNYNIAIIVSIVICAILSMLIGYYGALLILDETSGSFKMAQLIITIVSMTTFYAPIKFALLKYMNIKSTESENEND